VVYTAFFYFVVKSWNCRSKPPLQGAFKKSSLKIRKTFPTGSPLRFGKSFQGHKYTRRYSRHTLFMPDLFKIFYSFSCFFKKVLVFSLLFRYNQYVSGELW